MCVISTAYDTPEILVKAGQMRPFPELHEADSIPSPIRLKSMDAFDRLWSAVTGVCSGTSANMISADCVRHQGVILKAPARSLGAGARLRAGGVPVQTRALASRG